MRWLLFTVLSLFWGGSFIAIKFTIAAIPPLMGAGLRVAIGTLLAYFFVRRQAIPWPTERRLWWHSIGMGMTGMAIPWACLFWGEQYVAGALASIINSTVPIFVVLLALVLLRQHEHTNRTKIAGVLCGFVGIVVIFAPELSASTALSGSKPLMAMLAITLMSISYAVNIIWLRRVASRINRHVNLTIQGVGAAGALFVMSLLFEPQGWLTGLFGSAAGEHTGQLLPGDLAAAFAGVLYLGVFSTFLGWLIFFHLIQTIGAVRAGAVTFVVPLVAIVVDWVVAGTWITLNQAIGMLCIFSGLAMINWLSERSQRRPETTETLKKVA